MILTCDADLDVNLVRKSSTLLFSSIKSIKYESV